LKIAAFNIVKMDANNLILAVRNISKGKAAKADILKSNSASKTRVEVWNLNQEFIKSVNAFGKRVQGLLRLGVANRYLSGNEAGGLEIEE
jgi:hypothetical protein